MCIGHSDIDSLAQFSMRNLLREHRKIVHHADFFLSVLNQSILSTIESENLFRRLLQQWPMFYNFGCCVFYTYLIFLEPSSLNIVCEQMYCLVAIVQCVGNISNGFWNRIRLRKLLTWCETNYTVKPLEDFQDIYHTCLGRRNTYIKLFVK